MIRHHLGFRRFVEFLLLCGRFILPLRVALALHDGLRRRVVGVRRLNRGNFRCIARLVFLKRFGDGLERKRRLWSLDHLALGVLRVDKGSTKNVVPTSLIAPNLLRLAQFSLSIRRRSHFVRLGNEPRARTDGGGLRRRSRVERERRRHPGVDGFLQSFHQRILGPTRVDSSLSARLSQLLKRQRLCRNLFIPRTDIRQFTIGVEHRRPKLTRLFRRQLQRRLGTKDVRPGVLHRSVFIPSSLRIHRARCVLRARHDGFDARGWRKFSRRMMSRDIAKFRRFRRAEVKGGRLDVRRAFTQHRFPVRRRVGVGHVRSFARRRMRFGWGS